MRVLEINAYNFRSGGSQTVFFNTSEGLRELGHEVIPFTLKWDDNEPSEYNSYFPESKDSRRGKLKSIHNIFAYFYHREAARKLDRLIRDTHPDIAQIHLIWGQLSPSILAVLRKHKIPAVLTNHDYRLVCPAYLFMNGKGQVCEQCEGRKFYKCVSNTCCKGSKGLSAMMAAEQYFRNAFFNPAKYASGLIYVSDFSKKINEKYMPKLASKPNLRLYNFASKIVDDTLIPEKKYFLFFGRLSFEKGIGLLVETFTSFPDIKLKIVGTGPEEENIKEAVRKAGAKNIELLGYKKGRELEELVKNAYCVVVPSECYENNPMTIVEAYSAGTPVIGAAIGGIPEIIEEAKTGFTFRHSDVESFKEAITRFMALTPEQYKEMRANALEFARKHFSKKKYMERLVKFFESLIEKR